MKYVKIYPRWAPYAPLQDPRGFISRRFGAGHSGVDSVCNQWANPVCAVLNGRVAAVQNHRDLGIMVEIVSGELRLAFCHLAKALVVPGDRVEPGTRIGIEGSTGRLARGKHLHVSLWIGGVLSDPEPLLSGAGMLQEQEEKTMKFKAGDRVRAVGTIAPSAYSTAGTAAGKNRILTVTRVYPGCNFPYQCGKTGFLKESEAEPAEGPGEISRQEYSRLCTRIQSLEQKLSAVRRALD